MADKYNISDVFISYSRKDKVFAERLFNHLKAEDREVWADWEDIPLTADWWAEIQAGIEGADTFVFIISPNSVMSDVCFDEIDHAIKNNKRIVPVLYQEANEPEHHEKMHKSIGSHNWIFFREEDDFDDAYRKLILSLETDLAYVQAHTRYLVRATEWDDRERSRSYLLTDAEILEAEGWLSEAGSKNPKPTQIQTEYIFESRNQRIRRNRRNQIIAGIVIVVLALVTAVAAFQAIEAKNQRDEVQVQRAEAIRQRERAHLLALAGNSQIVTANNNIDLGIALALAANEGDPEQRSGETEIALANVAYEPGTIRRFTEHEARVQAVAFSPDGTFAVSGDERGVVFVWEVETGKVIHQLEKYPFSVIAVAIDPTQQYVATASCGEQNNNLECTRGEIILWDIETGEEIRRFEGHEDDINAIEFDVIGDRLLSGSVDRTMRLWDVKTGDEIRIYRHLGHVVDVAFHPLEPNIAISMAIDTPPTLWELDTGREIIHYDQHNIYDEPNLDVGSVAFSPDGSQILGSYGIPLRLWDTETGELIHEFLGHGSYVNSVAFSSDGRFALSSAWREAVFILWDVKDGIELRRFDGHIGVIQQLALSLDNRFILSASDDQTVRLWDLTNGAEVSTLPGHTDDIFSTIYSPNMDNGYIVASAGDDELIRIWDVETKQQIAKLDKHFQDVWTLAFSSDGSKLVSGSEDRTARVWDMETYEQLVVLEPHDDWVTTVAVSPDGRTILTGSNDKKVRLWDIETGDLIQEYAGDDGQLRSVVFTPDGTRFVAGADYARLFDIETGDVLQKYTGHSSRINSAAFNSNGSMLATGSADATIRIWETESGRLFRILEGHSGQVRTVEFSNDDTRILSSSADATVRLWSIGGLVLRIFEGHSTWVNQASFSPDDQFIASGSWDDTIKIWHNHSIQELIDWINNNRYVRAMSCNEELVYGLRLGYCDD